MAALYAFLLHWLNRLFGREVLDEMVEGEEENKIGTDTTNEETGEGNFVKIPSSEPCDGESSKRVLSIKSKESDSSEAAASCKDDPNRPGLKIFERIMKNKVLNAEVQRVVIAAVTNATRDTEGRLSRQYCSHIQNSRLKLENEAREKVEHQFECRLKQAVEAERAKSDKLLRELLHEEDLRLKESLLRANENKAKALTELSEAFEKEKQAAILAGKVEEREKAEMKRLQLEYYFEQAIAELEAALQANGESICDLQKRLNVMNRTRVKTSGEMRTLLEDFSSFVKEVSKGLTEPSKELIKMAERVDTQLLEIGKSELSVDTPGNMEGSSLKSRTDIDSDASEFSLTSLPLDSNKVKSLASLVTNRLISWSREFQQLEQYA